MVIGHGLIATTFSSFKKEKDILIFASGISNSAETDSVEFEREIALLKSFASTQKQLIYFSTVSVHDPDLIKSLYIQHKKRVESLIQELFKRYLIIRLPIIVSNSPNTHTLTNFLYNKIRTNVPVPVYKYACRYLIDIEDAKVLVTKMIQSKQFQNETIDVNFQNAIPIDDLIKIYESALNLKAFKQYIERGAKYETNNHRFIEFAYHLGVEIPPEYIESMIKKYYSSGS